MNIQLIQLLDCEGERIALYAFDGNKYTHEQAGSIIDREYKRGKEQLSEANPGLPEDIGWGPGDVQEYVDEDLSTLCDINRIYTEDHTSAHF